MSTQRANTRWRTGHRSTSRWRSHIAAAVAVAMLPALGLSATSAVAAPAPVPPAVPKPRVDKVQPFTPTPEGRAALARANTARAATAAAARRAQQNQARRVTWPSSGTVTVTVPPSGSVTAKPGSLPITLTRRVPKPGAAAASTVPTASARIQVLDRTQAARAGVLGVLLSVTPVGAPGTGIASVSVDYGSFANAYGGDFGGRLQLVRLPACALTTPQKAQCRTRTPVQFRNERKAERLTADVNLSTNVAAAAATQPLVLAVTAGTNSSTGDFKATALSPAATWQAGGSSGSFTWNYPLRMPPATAGSAPSLAVSYNSGSVDGRTASSNNQGTLLGEGFDITSSYVERKYHSCDDDGHDNKYDLCWKYDNAVLVLNGKATELVLHDPDGDGKSENGKPEMWRFKDDDGSKVEQLSGADNGVHDGEHWKVTTGDGTQYFFGLEKLPGAKDDRTSSVWSVPVFGDDAGEPCHDDTFAKSHCTQAWRWNLDYVVDTHDNAMSYWYTPEDNYYAKNGTDDEKATRYVRGGYLHRIQYGQRDKHLFTERAPQKVEFGYDERCLVSCDKLTRETKGNWPDVPFDSICDENDKCTGRTGPSFFTRNRLTSVTTYVWKADTDTGGPGYQPVDSWSLKHAYLDPGDIGDSSDQSLWLESITHTGRVGPDSALPPVTFRHTWKTNRVDTTDDVLPLNKPRLEMVISETGAITTVDYSDPQCSAEPENRRMPSAENNSTLRCYPVRWRPNGGDVAPEPDWFHKYVVTDVRTIDPTGGSRPLVYRYEYGGDPAWHYTDDPLTTPKERTWSQWRGYGKVTALAGEPGEVQRSKTVTVYMRGMNGDRLTNDSRRPVTVEGITAPPIDDDNELAGFVRETVTYDGENGPEVSGTVNDPWTRQTAKRHYPWLDVTAHYVRTAATHSRTRITSPKPSQRSRTIATAYDDFGMAETVDDHGDNGKTGDETCTRTWYARNSNAGLVSLVTRVRKLAVPCKDENKATLPTDPGTPGDVISDTAVAYDTTSWSERHTPTKGNRRWEGRISRYKPDRTPEWQTVNTSTFDDLGRIKTATNAKGHATSTRYTPTAGGPLTQMAVTNAEDQTTTTTVEPAWGTPARTEDANGNVTTLAYDAVGRLEKVYLPNVAHPNGQSPNIVYTYHLSATDASWVSTATLRGNSVTKYNTTHQIFDALLRPRQSQAPSPNGGRIIGETFYDSRGHITKTYADVYDDKHEPSGQLYGTVNAQAPSETRLGYDGAGRPTTSTLLTYGVVRWSTTSSYTGDSVGTTAPAGGSATREFSDIFGRIAERRTYAGTAPEGPAYTSIAINYAPNDRIVSIVGPDKAKWTYRYDILGRETYESDPDKGETITAHTVLDQIDWTEDANKAKLLYSYDKLGRKTNQWSGVQTDANLQASWGYDNIAMGHQDTMTRYIGGRTGKAYIKKVTKFDDLYRPTTTQIELPADDPLVVAGVPAKLEFSNSYNIDGTPQYSTEPAVAGLPRESVSVGYNALGMPVTMSGATGYVLGATYNPLGDMQQLRLGTSEDNPKQVTLTNNYEPGTRRLKTSGVTDTTHNYKLQDLTYDYDDAGNITSIFDAATLGGTGHPDYQCFTYDGYRRLAHAWTPENPDCAPANRDASKLGGAAPYWTSYDYNDVGLRKTDTQHARGGNTLTTYNYAEGGQPPHALTSTRTTKPGGSATTNSYRYDKVGNTTNRPGTNATQTLAWDGEGKLRTVSEPATPTTAATNTGYLYDADGGLLIRHPTSGHGETVLYLGATEVRLTTTPTTKQLSATRYYTIGDTTVAVRATAAGAADSKLHFLAGDRHGTAGLAIEGSLINGKPALQTHTKRYTTPFGATRGPRTATWPDDKMFLGKPADLRTGLTHIGAREYDPTIGRFISVDPLLDSSDAQSLNGFAYANNNPITLSDPTGLCVTIDDYGTCYHPPRGGGTTNDSQGETNTSSGNGSSGGTSSPYIPISDHVFVQSDDPRFEQMSQAYRNMLQKVRVPKGKMSRAQEDGIWFNICVLTPGNICGDGLRRQLIDVVDNREVNPDQSVVMVGKDFSSTGGAAVVVILSLVYKDGWTAEQRAAADRKVAELNKSELRVTQVERKGSAREMMKRAGVILPTGMDADHIKDLQLGGKNEVRNLWGLNYSVNRSLGAQIMHQITKLGLKPGDRVDGVRISQPTIGEQWNGPGRGTGSGGGRR